MSSSDPNQTTLAVSELSRQEILDLYPTAPAANVAVLHYGVDQEMRPGTYEPLRQNPVAFLQAAVRGTSVDVGLVGAVRAVTTEVDPALALFDPQMMSGRVERARKRVPSTAAAESSKTNTHPSRKFTSSTPMPATLSHGTSRR